MTHIEKLRIKAAQSGIYAIEEAPNKWLCIKKAGTGYLAKGVFSESLALRVGLDKTKVQQQQINM